MTGKLPGALMNQAFHDGQILRGLGLLLAKQEGSEAKRPAQAQARGQRPEAIVSVCAWCQREKGEAPKPNQSHGICERHRDVMLAELAARRAA